MKIDPRQGGLFGPEEPAPQRRRKAAPPALPPTPADQLRARLKEASQHIQRPDGETVVARFRQVLRALCERDGSSRVDVRRGESWLVAWEAYHLPREEGTRSETFRVTGLCLSDVWAAVVWLEEDEQHRTWHGLYALCKAQGGEYRRAS
jgi:hypothetical protein